MIELNNFLIILKNLTMFWQIFDKMFHLMDPISINPIAINQSTISTINQSINQTINNFKKKSINIQQQFQKKLFKKYKKNSKKILCKEIFICNRIN